MAGTIFTRTVYTVSACVVTYAERPDGLLEPVCGDSVTYYATSENQAEARAALKDAGIKVPRGSKIRTATVGEAVYGMDLDTFMANAVQVERWKKPEAPEAE